MTRAQFVSMATAVAMGLWTLVAEAQAPTRVPRSTQRWRARIAVLRIARAIAIAIRRRH